MTDKRRPGGTRVCTPGNGRGRTPSPGCRTSGRPRGRAGRWRATARMWARSGRRTPGEAPRGAARRSARAAIPSACGRDRRSWVARRWGRQGASESLRLSQVPLPHPPSSVRPAQDASPQERCDSCTACAGSGLIETMDELPDVSCRWAPTAGSVTDDQARLTAFQGSPYLCGWGRSTAATCGSRLAHHPAHQDRESGPGLRNCVSRLFNDSTEHLPG